MAKPLKGLGYKHPGLGTITFCQLQLLILMACAITITAIITRILGLRGFRFCPILICPITTMQSNCNCTQPCKHS